jgi:hypothetical protein
MKKSSSIFILFCMGMTLRSLTLTEEHRLRVFERKVPRRLFGPKRED